MRAWLALLALPCLLATLACQAVVPVGSSRSPDVRKPMDARPAYEPVAVRNLGPAPAGSLNPGPEPARLPPVVAESPPNSGLVRQAAFVPAGELPSPQLSLAELENLALRNNPSLVEALALVEMLRGRWLQAGLCPNPSLGYVGQQLFSHGLAEQHGLLVTQELVRGNKLGLSQEAIEREIQRAEQEVAAQRWKVLTDVRLAYYDVLLAERRLELTGRLVEVSGQAAAGVQRLYEQKESSQIDLLQARVEANSAKVTQNNTRNQRDAAWRRLRAVIGTANLPMQNLAGDIERPPVEIQAEERLQQLLRESPEVLAAYASVEAANWWLTRAHAEVVPNVEVQGMWQSDNGIRGTDGFVQLTLPLPIINRNQGGIHEAESRVLAARQAVSRVEFDLRRRFADTYPLYAAARQQVTVYRTDILPDAQRTLDLVRQGYLAGELSYLNLLTAQRTFFHTNLEYLDALRQMWQAWIELEGMLLRGSLKGVGRAE